MPKIKKLNAIQAWLHTQTGQTFLNYAYSWGASIVILGALFKLTHIAGADLMLFIGMGTEVIVFFLSGFDTPQVEEIIPHTALAEGEEAEVEQGGGTVVVGGGGIGGGTIIIGGGGGGSVAAPVTEGEGGVVGQQPNVSGGTVVVGGGGPVITPSVIGGGTPVVSGGTPVVTGGEPVDAAALAENISNVTIPNVPGMPPAMQEATQAYVEQLNELTDILKKVADQSARLTRDSEEMEMMNRTLTGINRFYEIQLRSVGQQSATIDDVTAQTQRLAEQLEELNGVYARMVEALKIKVG